MAEGSATNRNTGVLRGIPPFAHCPKHLHEVAKVTALPQTGLLHGKAPSRD